MKQVRIPAAFIRGGTSNAIVFHQNDLPEDRAQWDAIFLAAIGSPDPNGRQLNGMGGGISSLSKICIVGPSTHPEADIDYTFAQCAVRDAAVQAISSETQIEAQWAGQLGAVERSHARGEAAMPFSSSSAAKLSGSSCAARLTS